MAGPKATAQYEAVRAKIDAGLSVKEAIEEVARELGMTRASVQTTYYRTRQELEEKPAPSITSRSGDVTSEQLLRQAVEALTILARRAEAQDKDLERLRRIERALSEDT